MGEGKGAAATLQPVLGRSRAWPRRLSPQGLWWSLQAWKWSPGASHPVAVPDPISRGRHSHHLANSLAVLCTPMAGSRPPTGRSRCWLPSGSPHALFASEGMLEHGKPLMANLERVPRCFSVSLSSILHLKGGGVRGGVSKKGSFGF